MAIPIQFPANTQEGYRGWTKFLEPAIHIGNMESVLDSWLWCVSALAITDMCGIKQQKELVSPPHPSTHITCVFVCIYLQM